VIVFDETERESD